MKSRVALLLLTIAVTGTAAESERIPLAFAQIELLDGRRLEQVLVRNYDPANDRVLVVAGGTARLLPLSQVPASLAETLRGTIPFADGTVSVVADPFGPAPASNDATRAGEDGEDVAPVDSELFDPGMTTEHRAAALARAERFFRYEFQSGWSSIALNAVDFEMREPRPVAGRPGRFRLEGTAYLEFYDSWTRYYRRTTSRFAVITEKRDGEPARAAFFALQ